MNATEFLDLWHRNAEHRVARRLKRDLAKRRLTDSLDELTLPPSAGLDLPVRRLPKTCSHSARDFHVRLALRDSVLSHAELFTDEEMSAAALWLEGYSPLAIFRALGVSSTSGYRRLAPFLKQLQEICNHD